MMNRTKLIYTVAAVAVAAALTACGAASSTSAASTAASEAAPASSVSADAAANDSTNGSTAAVVEAAYNTLADANPISNKFEIEAMNIEYDFALQAEDIVSYKGVKSNDNGDAGMVLVIQPADGKLQTVVSALEAYQQSLIDTAANYPSDFAQALENAQNAIISDNGTLVVMVVNSNECTADLTSTVESALNG